MAATPLRLLTALALAATACGATPPATPWILVKAPLPPIASTQVTTLVDGGPRATSPVLIRRVARPTRANLDYAAYHASPMLYAAPPETPIAQPHRLPPLDALFGGAFAKGSLVASLDETPLSPAERAAPLSFTALVDYTCERLGADCAPLEDARSAIRAESYGTPERMDLSRQEPADAWVHRSATGQELWVEIELWPFAAPFAGMADPDQDGLPEIYGRLRQETVADEIFELIDKDYATKLLDAKALGAWVNRLASYWYPSYNTDIFRAAEVVFPTADVEPEVVKALCGVTVGQPAAVIRGTPRGTPIYQVFVVPGIETIPRSGVQSRAVPTRPAEVTAHTAPLALALASELAAHGGSYAQWNQELALLHNQLTRLLASRPEASKAFVGKDGYLFYRNSLRYAQSGDLTTQTGGKNPLPAIVELQRFLASRGIDFLFVPVPTKVEVLADKLLDLPTDGPPPVLNPYGRKLLADLAAQGVESVDLLPVFLTARQADIAAKEPLYLKQDTHWTARGIELAADVLERRIRAFPWYGSLPGAPTAYTEQETTFREQGDLVSRLAPKEQRRYRPMTLTGRQVQTPAGTLYEDVPESPIVLLGDSFTGVYELTFCGSAGISARLARRVGRPLDLMMSYGGGPNVRRQLLSRGLDALANKKLVIWMFSARDLYDYWEPYAPLEIPTDK